MNGADDVDIVLGIAKRELEKERETLMSRSLPGIENNANERADESDSDSGSESEDCGKFEFTDERASDAK